LYEERGMSKKLMPHPIFIMSLDTELLWGYILHPQDIAVKLLSEDKSKGRGAIETLLQLFEKYNISATWALVGHLFFNSNEAKEIVHPRMPEFKEGWLEWDSYNSIYNMPLYYGGDIVEKILASSVRHEIGLHSFSHIPFSQCSREVGVAELELGMKAAKRFGITPKSFVFPGDYIGHLDVLKRQGFKIYRGKQLGRHGINQSFLLQKFNGAIDRNSEFDVFL
jgi:peptidoglycan/xylan/chitin deacetylase (PgdA/CDA1 family)